MIVKAISFVALFTAFALAGCGGSGSSPAISKPLTGSYVGTWTTSQGAASQGQATVQVTATNMVSWSIINSSNPGLTENGSGQADSNGNFSGNMSNSLRTQTFTGVISGTPSQISVTINYPLTPGAQGSGTGTWYITATPAAQ